MIGPMIGFIDVGKGQSFLLCFLFRTFFVDSCCCDCWYETTKYVVAASGGCIHYPGWLFLLEVPPFMCSRPSSKLNQWLVSLSALWIFFYKQTWNWNSKKKRKKEKKTCLWSGFVQPSWRFFQNQIYDTRTSCISLIQREDQEIIVLWQNCQVRGQYVAMCVHGLLKCFFFTGYINTEAQHLFVYFFESRNDPDKDDVIFWTALLSLNLLSYILILRQDPVVLPHLAFSWN